MSFNDDDDKDGPGKKTKKNSSHTMKVDQFESDIRKAIEPSDEFNTTYVMADFREEQGRFLLGVVGNKLKQVSVVHSHRDLLERLLQFIKKEPESHNLLGLTSSPSGKVIVICHTMRVSGLVSDDVHPFVVKYEEIEERLKPILKNM